ncbi:MAG: hemerythrin domain-containing protein, partial [Rhodoferax sp.]|nr:hemerythrin domain-containing protein [Rhodoferax sp.]
ADAGRHGALVARLQDDHRRMAAAWPAPRAALQAVADGRWTTEGASPAVQAWQDFAALYGPHIDAEEQLAYPAARALADAEAAHAMGTEMAARRGLTAVNPSR